jgi:molybdopterin-guanine dinucleotide biosynthesis protein A
MGRDKAWLEIGGETMVARLVRILESLFESVRIVANEIDRYDSLGKPVHADLRPGSGPLGGIHTALSKTHQDTAFVVGCDYPFINANFINGLSSLLSSYDALVPLQNQIPVPVCAFYSTRCLGAVEASLDKGILEANMFLAEVDVRWVKDEELSKLDPTGLALTNLNTPDDYRKALALLEKKSLF